MNSEYFVAAIMAPIEIKYKTIKNSEKKDKAEWVLVPFDSASDINEIKKALLLDW